jgi:hypothetical protein
MTNSRISDSRPLEYLSALVNRICLTYPGSLMTTKVLGPKERRKILPYVR